jgi:O-antigen/teichoic acid export membrane protein
LMSLFTINLWFVAWAWVATYAILSVGYFGLFYLKHPEIFRAKHYPMKAIYTEFMPILIPTFLANNAGSLFAGATETMLVFFRGTADVGLYQIAKPISNLAMAITSPVANLLKPYVSQVDEQQSHGTLRALLAIVLNASVFLVWPFAVMLMFYSRESIVFLFGAQYESASLTLKFVAFEILLNILSIFIFSIVFGLGLQKNRAKIMYVSSCVSLILSLLLIPRFGAVGVAISNLAYNTTAILGGLFIIYHKVTFELPLANYARIGVLTVIMITSQWLLKVISPDTLSLQFVLFICKVSLGLLLYFGIGIFVFRILDLKLLINIVQPHVPAWLTRTIRKL